MIASFCANLGSREQLAKERVEAVNVGGTKNVINACIECGVSALVYTSTTNVVFSGNALPNKDESQPYLPLEKHIDAYSRSKALAEQVTTLSPPLRVGGSLPNSKLPCSSHIEGNPSSQRLEVENKGKGRARRIGDLRHPPCRYLWRRRGTASTTNSITDESWGVLFYDWLSRLKGRSILHIPCLFQVIDFPLKVEFIYVDNLVHAHILAAIKLLQKGTLCPTISS